MKNGDVMVAREGGVEGQSNIWVSSRWEKAEAVFLERFSPETLAEIIVRTVDILPYRYSITTNTYGSVENLLESNHTGCFIVHCRLLRRKCAWKIIFSSHIGKRKWRTSTNHWKVMR